MSDFIVRYPLCCRIVAAASTATTQPLLGGCLGDERLLLSFLLRTVLDILVHIKILMSIDPDLGHLAEVRKGMAVVEQNVGILSDFQRADFLIDHQLLGGIDRDQRQRLGFLQATVLHGFSGFGVEWRISSAASEFSDTSTPFRTIMAAL